MKHLSASIILLLFVTNISAQENLLNMLNQDTVKQLIYTTAAFKSTRVMNGHSIKMMPPGQLDLRISHRFGPVNYGLYQFFGLDQSVTHFSLEYGILNWLMVGAGRGTFEKTYDGFVKLAVLRQSTGARVMPVSVLLFSSAAIASVRFSDQDRNNLFSSRLSYAGQVLVGRKFSESLSLQLAPTFVHRNLVPSPNDPNDLYSIGAGGRFKLTKHICFNAEYYYLVNSRSQMSQKIYNPLSLGFDIETGGHVFQLIFTNSYGMIEKSFIGETTGRWAKGDIHFGFNISRVFTLKRSPPTP
ncbi:MAG: DUF5777 family beta-barrel protein [Bacteroidota bacterium]|nr:DUF5777 family beta-barrel protein [Bacteroidota bacterium]